ncbi:hypothetical protein FACS1894200_03990 [Spirochaetia bacterium]|nr:hypothetical protein FACS1894200_03990 [Spirochaetia bacterium]
MKNSCLLLVMTLFAVLPFASCEAPANTDPGFTYEDWLESTMPAKLTDAMDWIKVHGVPCRTYTIVLKANETISFPFQLYNDRTLTGVTIILKGDGVERTIELDNRGNYPSPFDISGLTLILDENITLRRNGSGGGALVRVWNGGILEMRDGAKISGGGVSVDGVYLNGSSGNSTFIMNGGVISGNTASYGGGGGVYVNGSSGNSTFIMNGGVISGNTASYGGGGVYVNGSSGNSTFIMNGGVISGNTTTSYIVGGGGGVSVSVSGTFTMNGGVISGNTASDGGGGGVSVSVSGTFTMNDGVISGNTASDGGGVYVSGGTFTMNDGVISGNTASGGGGGVSVGGGTFTKSGPSIIYGDNASGIEKNTASSGNGHAVYYWWSSSKKRNATLGAGVNLSTNDLITNWDP